MVNVFPVDLEYLQFVDLTDPEQQRLVDATIHAQLDPLPKDPNTLILGTVLWEYNTNKIVRQNFHYFQNKCQDLGVQNHFLVGPEKLYSLADFDNCTFIDFFLVRSYYVDTQTDQIFNHAWYPENKKFLFLMGKALKPHRIGLLWRFYKQGLLDNNRCTWSFYDKISVNDCKKLVPSEANLHDLEKLINNYQQSPDQVTPINNHYGGFPFDSLVYKNTNISVVSETMFDSGPWNTEKIYRTILNHHPFVIAGAVNHTEHLNSMGFETFNQYLAVPDYSSITDLNSRLNAIVKNVKEFDPSTEQIQQIHDSTHKNVRRLHELAKHYIDTINKMLDRYKASKSWTEILPLQDTDFLTWKYYYQQIKDPSWPSCATVSDCANLPAQIQEELRNRFNVNF